MPSSPSMIEIISKRTISLSPGTSHGRRCCLTPWDVAMLCPHYIQKGLLFTNLPPNFPTHRVLSLLETSLSDALRHFYPLAGRLQTQSHRNLEGQVTGLEVYIDCNDEGAEFIHAVAENITADDVVSPGKDIPSFVNYFFPLNRAINYDGQSAPLLSLQLTELADGALFLACCFNHVVGDGTSYWNFFNGWAEIARTNILSRTPVHDRWFIEGESPPVKLPFSKPSQFVVRFSPPLFRERFFHFSSHSVAKLKARANAEVGSEELVISSFQALSALLWRAITRARGFAAEQLTGCRLAMQNRERLRPKLSPEYFGNSIYAVPTTVAAGELLAKGIGWAALQLNRAIAGYTDAKIRGMVRAYHEARWFIISPCLIQGAS
ncbi:Omega-hydroxypalmitate O-feruloyl transferase [Platanthera zijinensis]|uniref:Omega-hydroxypalmitate O-feruloyl transferase n=1 Tax=Platanthera zijinensis TaxID=2320716 RepID=A0AAP0FUN3_9ASPA